MVRAQTFGDYAERWIEQRDIKESSKRDYRRQLKAHVADALGAVPLRALDAATIRSWFAALDTTAHGRHKVFNLVHSVCATAVGDGLLSPNPCNLTTVRKPPKQVKPVVLEPAELTAAVNTLEPQRFRAPVLIAAWCGLRWGELGELRRKDISEDAETITVARGFDHEAGCTTR